MKKTLMTSVIAAILTTVTFNANAGGKSTLSLDYAQSHLKFKKGEYEGNPKGINIKYRYEINNHWGIISSFTYTKQEEEFKLYGIKLADVDVIYSSLSFGPTYRFNENISIYGLVGAARGRIEAKSAVISAFKDTETELVYGAGLQFNPVKNVAIDVSYEQTKLSFAQTDLKNVKVGTWMLGVGYRF